MLTPLRLSPLQLPHHDTWTGNSHGAGSAFGTPLLYLYFLLPLQSPATAADRVARSLTIGGPHRGRFVLFCVNEFECRQHLPWSPFHPHIHARAPECPPTLHPHPHQQHGNANTHFCVLFPPIFALELPGVSFGCIPHHAACAHMYTYMHHCSDCYWIAGEKEDAAPCFTMAKHRSVPILSLSLSLSLRACPCFFALVLT